MRTFKTIVVIVGLLLIAEATAAACTIPEGCQVTTKEVDGTTTTTCTDVGGKIKITSLAMLTAFSKRGCTIYEGHFTVRGAAEVVDLEPLAGLQHIASGMLYIRDNAKLLNLHGLRNLRGVLADALIIRNNVKLTDLEGLQGISGIGGSGKCDEGLCMYVDDHPLLLSLKGLRGLNGTVPGGIKIQNNDALLTLDGLEGGRETEREGGRGVWGGGVERERESKAHTLTHTHTHCLSLSLVPPLEGITSVTGFDEERGFSITIEGHASLQFVTALDHITGVLPGALMVWANPKLESLQGVLGIEAAGKEKAYEDGNAVYFGSNPSLCVTEAERAALAALCKKSAGYGVGAAACLPKDAASSWWSNRCSVCGDGGSSNAASRTHSTCGVGLFCDYYGGGRCMCFAGFAGLGCTTPTSSVRALKTSFKIFEPSNRTTAFTVRIPLERTPSVVDVNALELVEHAATGDNTGRVATPMLAGTIKALEQYTSVVAGDNKQLLDTTLQSCASAANAAADYELSQQQPVVTWTNKTHGHIAVGVTVRADDIYEEKETITLLLRPHSTLYRDCVLVGGPTEVKIEILDREPGVPYFVNSTFSVHESEAFATVVLERVGGNVGILTVSVVLDEAATTATPGEDFIFTRAVATWENGDISPKAIAIRLLNDVIEEVPDEVIALRINGTIATTRAERTTVTRITITNDSLSSTNTGTIMFVAATIFFVIIGGTLVFLSRRPGGISHAVRHLFAGIAVVVLNLVVELMDIGSDFVAWYDVFFNPKLAAFHVVYTVFLGLTLITAAYAIHHRCHQVIKAYRKTDAEVLVTAPGILKKVLGDDKDTSVYDRTDLRRQSTHTMEVEKAKQAKLADEKINLKVAGLTLVLEDIPMLTANIVIMSLIRDQISLPLIIGTLFNAFLIGANVVRVSQWRNVWGKLDAKTEANKEASSRRAIRVVPVSSDF